MTDRQTDRGGAIWESPLSRSELVPADATGNGKPERKVIIPSTCYPELLPHATCYNGSRQDRAVRIRASGVWEERIHLLTDVCGDGVVIIHV